MFNVHIKTISAEELTASIDKFCDLLRDAVEHGASIGFTLPLTDSVLIAYWEKIAAELPMRHKILFASFEPDGRLAGSAQLALEMRSNGRHRAEVQKVMVLTSHRGRSIGAALMSNVEAEAKRAKRSLLFLDTSMGEGGAAKFYEKLGYVLAGSIPDYAADPDGRLTPNAIFYKKLP